VFHYVQGQKKESMVLYITKEEELVSSIGYGLYEKRWSISKNEEHVCICNGTADLYKLEKLGQRNESFCPGN
jgi:hypothetical protein